MPPLDELYSRLLVVYPQEYRQHHEAEMVSTLLDVARPGQKLPSWRESLALIVGGLRTRAREAVRQGPRALWWDGLRLGAVALLAGQAANQLMLSFSVGPYVRPHVSPLLLGLTAVALARMPARWGLALIGVDAVAMWPAPLPAYTGSGMVMFAPNLLPFQSGPYPLVIGPWVYLALAATAFALAPPAAGPRRAWPWWIVGPLLAWPLAVQTLILRAIPFPLEQAAVLSLFTATPILVCLALGALSVVAHDPRPSIAAAVYFLGYLVAQLPYAIPFVFWNPFSDVQDVLVPLLLLVGAAAAIVVSSRTGAHT